MAKQWAARVEVRESILGDRCKERRIFTTRTRSKTYPITKHLYCISKRSLLNLNFLEFSQHYRGMNLSPRRVNNLIKITLRCFIEKKNRSIQMYVYYSFFRSVYKLNYSLLLRWKIYANWRNSRSAMVSNLGDFSVFAAVPASVNPFIFGNCKWR